MTYCVDVGSISRGNFGWARVTDVGWNVSEGNSAPASLVEALHRDCESDELVSIGFESPLFLPLRSTVHHPWGGSHQQVERSGAAASQAASFKRPDCDHMTAARQAAGWCVAVASVAHATLGRHP